MNTAPAPGLLASLLRGGLGFAAVSVAAYSIWAFGGGWFKERGGDPAMFTVIAVAFLAGSGLLLHPLLGGSRRLLRFYVTFVPAYAAYAAAWCAAWFTLGREIREWVASLGGSLLFSLVIALRHGRMRSLWKIVPVLFVLHSTGYFLGGVFCYWMIGFKDPALATLGKLGWGLFHGLGMGLGIGYAFHAAQSDARR